MYPHSFSLLDPDPGEKNNNRKNARTLVIITTVQFHYHFKGKFGQAPFFFTFEQQFFFFNYNKLFIGEIFKAGSGSALKNHLDSDPH